MKAAKFILNPLRILLQNYRGLTNARWVDEHFIHLNRSTILKGLNVHNPGYNPGKHDCQKDNREAVEFKSSSIL